MKVFFENIFSRENLIALVLCLILVALVIFTADFAGTNFLYEGF